jgi:hypothetical protein
MLNLKKVEYLADLGYAGEVVYVITGACCFFAGTRKAAMSTINAAEEVVEGICDEEGLDWRDLMFYDLQTRAGYRSKQNIPGQFECDQLSITILPDGRPAVRAWQPYRCPEDIVKAFCQYIGSETRFRWRRAVT